MDGRALAIARDVWFSSEEGRRLTEGTASGQYLRNRLEMALYAGVRIAEEHIQKSTTSVVKK